MEIHCRAATADDAEVIADLNFRLIQETENREPDRDVLRRGAANGLRHFPEARYFVAESDDCVVGQMMLTREWSDWRDGWLLWLQSVYVRHEFRQKGVFQSLLGFCLDSATEAGDMAGIRLYVEHDNETAQTVYRRTGFTDAGYRIMEIVVPLSEDCRA